MEISCVSRALTWFSKVVVRLSLLLKYQYAISTVRVADWSIKRSSITAETRAHPETIDLCWLYYSCVRKYCDSLMDQDG